MNGSFCNLCALAGVTYLHYTVLTSPKKGETAVHCCNPAFIGSCHVGACLEAFFAKYQPCSLLSLHIFLAGQISCGSYVSNVYRMRSLAVNHSKHEPAILSHDIG